MDAEKLAALIKAAIEADDEAGRLAYAHRQAGTAAAIAQSEAQAAWDAVGDELAKDAKSNSGPGYERSELRKLLIGSRTKWNAT